MVNRLGIGAAFLVLTTQLGGCATTPDQFYAKRYQLSDAQLCRTLETSSSSDHWRFAMDVRADVESRGLSTEQCASIVRQQNMAIAGSIVVASAIVAAAANSRGGAAGEGLNATTDYAWEWDQYYNQYRNLVWSCRGVQTGQFAETYHCAGKLQSDWKWPGK